MNKSEHLGSYRLWDGNKWQGKVAWCFRCGSSVIDTCKYCEPYKADQYTPDKSKRKGRSDYKAN